MKISKIHLKNIQQFKDLEIDLTYPDGHEKAGEPLDKVCFIGQSGSGKTMLLNLIENIIKEIGDINFLDSKENLHIKSKESFFTFWLKDKNNTLRVTSSGNSYGYALENNSTSQDEFQSKSDIIENYKNELNKKSPSIIYYPFNNRHASYNHSFTTGLLEIIHEKSINFNLHSISDFTIYLTKYFLNYFGNKQYKLQELYNEIKDKSQDEKVAALNEFEIWDKQDLNPLKIIANAFLDNLLANFNLKLYTDFTKENFTGDNTQLLNFYNISAPNNIFSYDKLSSGLKSLITFTIPLHVLEPNNSFILFDEIENSFYPDIQQTLINSIVDIAPNNQYFFATHSPIITTSFEPWEIIELKLDEEGNVYQDLYYNNVRHINNFYKVPKYMSYGSILKEIFDLDTDGTQERKDKLVEIAYLEERIKYLKGKNENDKLNDTIEKYRNIANDLRWEFNSDL